MTHPIFAICFDVGGTLRTSYKNPTARRAALTQLHDALDFEGSLEALEELLKTRDKAYRHWCIQTQYELSEEDLWTKYLLPDYPADFVRQNAMQFNQLWRSGRDHILLPHMVETIQELSARGYKLAIISNTTSSLETPRMLAQTGLEALFPCVILSTTFGRRKPNPSLFIAAARQLGINPENCAFVGNDPTRDLIGARQAGFGKVILLTNTDTMGDDPDNDSDTIEKTLMKPDITISALSQLLDVFTDIHDQPAPAWQEQPLYDAALSTMWHVNQQAEFNQTFYEAKKIGFARFELNHRVSQQLFEQYDHDQFYIATVHEPCPADLTYEERKAADIAISNLDEQVRKRAVDDIKRSIDLAVKLNARSVVIHPGTVNCDKSIENHMRNMIQTDKRRSPEYLQLLHDAIAEREKLVKPNFDQVVRSMEEIIRFASGSGIALGLENRYHFDDIPLPDELEILLSLSDEDWLGFQYDVGHAQALDVLGFVRHFEWLERFSKRMIGVHLHDVICIKDHQAVGKGEVDFAAIAPYIPTSAQRTLEIGPRASLEELAESLKLLADKGCIEKI